ncbi:hypothetical protein M758_4G066700 [Ceratodon purpureus]|nr:hypothetical protein M758_4G066700 [Ceratodon purpureus]
MLMLIIVASTLDQTTPQSQHHSTFSPTPLRRGAWRGVEFGNWFEEDGGNGGRGGVGVAMERSCRRSCRW